MNELEKLEARHKAAAAELKRVIRTELHFDTAGNPVMKLHGMPPDHPEVKKVLANWFNLGILVRVESEGHEAHQEDISSEGVNTEASYRGTGDVGSGGP